MVGNFSLFLPPVSILSIEIVIVAFMAVTNIRSKEETMSFRMVVKWYSTYVYLLFYDCNS